jgi:acetyltransferase-like isoleucine patch superfamily enzyme
MKSLLLAFSIVLPWPLKRWLLRAAFGYQIDPTARIGLAWVSPKMLSMGAHSKIGDFTVCKGQDLVELKEHAIIGRGNWISGFPSNLKVHFQQVEDRSPALILGAHAAITSRHIIDCTDCVTIGDFTILAGFRSQILTHSIDIKESIQSCAKVTIGKYCFIGTDSVLLSGSAVPDYCIVGAKSLVNRKHEDTYQLYTGIPARAAKALDKNDKYFSRQEGFVI